MEEKTKLTMWIIINLLLLALLIYSGFKWVDINNTLKNPCEACASENESVDICFKLQRELNPLGIAFNWSEIKNNEINKSYGLAPLS